MEDKHIIDHYKETIGEGYEEIKPQKSWEFLQEKNNGRLDNIAISEGKSETSYGELFEDWKTKAKTFSGYDISKENGSRVLMILPNIMKMNSFDYGADITGAIASFPDPTIGYEQIKKYIEEEKITDIISLDLLFAKNMGGKAEELVKEYGIRNIFLVHDNYFTSLMPRKYQYLSSILGIGNKFNKYVTRYEDAERNTRFSQIKYDKTSGEDLKSDDAISIITHTSGTTTGIGKPIPLTDHNRNSLVNHYELAKFNYQPGMTMLHFIPYFAGYGSVNTVHLGLSQGLELQEIPLFNPNNFGQYMINYMPNIVLATSACWLSLINDPKYSNIDLSHFVYASTGGSPMSVDEEIKINYFLKKHGSKVPLTKGYGLSEMGGCSIVTVDGYNKIGSSGVIMPGINAKIKTTTGEIVDIGKEEIQGELLLNSDTLTCGKLDDKEVVKTIEIDGKKYLQTNDEVFIDSTGNVEYLGRKDGMFQRYDCYNVYPLQIESLFKSYSFIKNAAVVGYYSEINNGIVPKVIIELTDEAYVLDKKQIIDDIINSSFLSNNHHSEYKANFRDLPHVWDFVEQMPINTMEKNDLYSLQNDYYECERFIINVQEDNMSIREYNISEVIVNKNQNSKKSK